MKQKIDSLINELVHEVVAVALDDKYILNEDQIKKIEYLKKEYKKDIEKQLTE